MYRVGYRSYICRRMAVSEVNRGMMVHWSSWKLNAFSVPYQYSSSRSSLWKTPTISTSMGGGSLKEAAGTASIRSPTSRASNWDPRTSIATSKGRSESGVPSSGPVYGQRPRTISLRSGARPIMYLTSPLGRMSLSTSSCGCPWKKKVDVSMSLDWPFM